MPNALMPEKQTTHAEEINNSPAVQTGLLVGSVDNGGLATGLGQQRGVQVQLETLGDLVLKLDGRSEDVGGSPSLSEGQAVLGVGVLALQVARDAVGLVVAGTSDLEGDVRGSLGLDLQRSAKDGEVLGQQVVRRLAEILLLYYYFFGISILATSAKREISFWDAARSLPPPFQTMKKDLPSSVVGRAEEQT